MVKGIKETEIGLIPLDWEVKKIEPDVGIVKSGKRLPKGYSLSEVPNHPPYIRVADMMMGRIDESDIKYVPEEIADVMVKKLINLRVFSDENDRMNLALKDVNGELLIVSQFTLYANCKRGNRPDFIQAAKAEQANDLYEYIVDKCKENGINVQTGIFGADMKVELLNDGPVTIILDSNDILEINK